MRANFVNTEEPTWWQQALQDASDRVDTLEAELAALRTKAEAVAEEYDREPRLIASGAVAAMLREWVNA